MNEVSTEVARAASNLRVLIGRLSRRLRQPDSADEITMPQVSVLSRLDREGSMTSGALALADRVRPQSMCTTLAALETQGLVARHSDPHDGRRVVISLTTAGAQALQGARRIREERLGRAIAEGLTTEEQQTLIAALPLLDRLAELL